MTMRPVPRLASVLLLTLTAIAASAAGREDRLLGPAEARAYRAIGRLNLAGARFCTAGLISPREIVTAAHCLFHPVTGLIVPVSEMRFVAGLNRGKHAALRGIEAVAVPADFVLETARPGASIHRDFAVLRLDAPIGSSEATPLAVGVAGLPRDLAIIGYSRERAQAPSIIDRCLTIHQQGEVLALSCRITFGASGAPVIATIAGASRIYAIASAIAQSAPDRHEATLVVRIDPAQIEALRRELDRKAARQAE
jgi:protease YdgD